MDNQKCTYTYKNAVNLIGLPMKSGCSKRIYTPHPEIIHKTDQVCPDCHKPVIFLPENSTESAEP